ncbi:Hypothetical predicted protein, partial [Podarcis lilfordi]
MGIMTGASWGFSQSLVRLLAPRLVPGSALLVAPCSVEGELRGTCMALHVRGVPADLALDSGPQSVVHAAWKLRVDGPMEQLLLINNTSERAAPRCAPEHMQSAFLLQVW